jgi:hypothetical protein
VNAKVFVLPTCTAAMFLLSACDDGNDEATDTPTPEPTIVAIPGHEPGTTTGEPEVDAIVEALLSRDWSRIQPLVEVEEVVCVATPTRIGEVECPPGTAPGTPVRVASFGGCQGFRVLETELAGEAGLERVIPEGSRLYAVLRGAPEWVSDYMVLFAKPGPNADLPVFAQTISVSGGHIVHVNLGCGEDPHGRIAYLSGDRTVEFLLPPPQ